MNIETLNAWGEGFWSFAWPMLWQSSLLMVVVFVVDFLFARKIRASVRHVLWLVVLVKLLLPPTLALPTGVTWWLWTAKPVLVPMIKNVTVDYSNVAAPLTAIPQSAPVALPPPQLNGEGWSMLACGAISVGLLVWLVFNWLKVVMRTRRAEAGSFGKALEEARGLAGLRQRVRLKLVEDAMSPAVFGLLRPVILLPRALAKRLTPEQLRTVLLHEAIHVRRGDVWVNCAQTLLQIFYWWHPLLWLANARLRRLREEAVDDAVMAALDEAAEVYAPTLLEVAKFAFRRPLASLGLVGILESRSALRQRIERLVDFRPPRKAGLTLLPLCVIFAFGAVALPMGQAPVPENLNKPMILGESPMATNVVPVNPNGKATFKKLNDIVLTNVAYSETLNRVLHDLTKRSQEADPDHQGIQFKFTSSEMPVEINPSTGLPKVQPVVIDASNILINLELENASLKDVADDLCHVATPSIQYFIEDGTVVFAPGGMKYEMRAFKVDPNTFKQGLEDALDFPNEPPGLPHDSQDSRQDVSSLAKEFFKSLGVNMDPPKTVFYNDGLGVLFVYASSQDLDVIERAIAALDDVPPQVHIKARFMEVPTTKAAVVDLRAAGVTNEDGSILPEAKMKTLLHQLQSMKDCDEEAEPEATLITGRQVEMRATIIQSIITNFVYKADSTNQSGIVPETAPVETGPILDVVPVVLADGYTISVTAIPSRIDFLGYADASKLPPHYATNKLGEKVELPQVRPIFRVSESSLHANMWDNQTLVLFPKTKGIPFGWDEKVGKFVDEPVPHQEKKEKDKTLVVFVTVTLIDPTGNRIHSEDEMPFAKDAVPPQPQTLPDVNYSPNATLQVSPRGGLNRQPGSSP